MSGNQLFQKYLHLKTFWKPQLFFGDCFNYLEFSSTLDKNQLLPIIMATLE